MCSGDTAAPATHTIWACAILDNLPVVQLEAMARNVPVPDNRPPASAQGGGLGTYSVLEVRECEEGPAASGDTALPAVSCGETASMAFQW